MMRMWDWRRWSWTLLLCLGLVSVATAQTPTPSRNHAPGFSERPAGSRMVILPVEMELFSISAGGVEQPRADWTDAAQKAVIEQLQRRETLFGKGSRFLTEAEADELAELMHLHKAVVRSVYVHHMLAGPHALPTKRGLLDWSMGEAAKPLRDKTGADYALFIWVRDSYASAERKAAIVALAMLTGVGLTGGQQLAYASLLDLRNGQVVWFNSLGRGSGDLRNAEGAEETMATLLQRFPALAAR